MKETLIAVSGTTPQIITEVVWALAQKRKIELAEIHVLTTKEGEGRIERDLFDPEGGHWRRLCEEWGIPSDTPFEIHLLKDPQGSPLEDIRSSEESGLARDRIFALVQELSSDPETRLHGSIAGGRKSMGFLLGAAFQFFGRPQDRLYHVLVDPPEVERCPEFFYVPPQETIVQTKEGPLSTADVRIELADLPYVSVRELVRLDAPGFTTIASRVQEEIHQYHQIQQENRTLRRSLAEPKDLIGKSHAMRRIKEQISTYARNEATVLITGETGTGKEIVACSIHELSDRTKKPFVPLNCGAHPETLLESELFGAVKGAYTDLNMDECEDNVSRAAERLEKSRKWLYDQMERLGLEERWIKKRKKQSRI